VTYADFFFLTPQDHPTFRTRAPTDQWFSESPNRGVPRAAAPYIEHILPRPKNPAGQTTGAPTLQSFRSAAGAIPREHHGVVRCRLSGMLILTTVTIFGACTRCADPHAKCRDQAGTAAFSRTDGHLRRHRRSAALRRERGGGVIEDSALTSWLSPNSTIRAGRTMASELQRSARLPGGTSRTRVCGTGLVVVLFVHGGHHNAHDNDCNVQEARQRVTHASQQFDAAVKPQVVRQRRVIGIYVAARRVGQCGRLTLYHRRLIGATRPRGRPRGRCAALAPTCTNSSSSPRPRVC